MLFNLDQANMTFPALSKGAQGENVNQKKNKGKMKITIDLKYMFFVLKIFHLKLLIDTNFFI